MSSDNIGDIHDLIVSEVNHLDLSLAGEVVYRVETVIQEEFNSLQECW